MSSSQGRVWSALGTVYLVWGSTYLAIRWSLETMPPFLSAAARFLVGRRDPRRLAPGAQRPATRCASRGASFATRRSAACCC